MGARELPECSARQAGRAGCRECGALVVGRQHRCPAAQACIDCGARAEIFVPDPARFPLGVVSEEAEYWTGEVDVAFCDRCVQVRLGRGQAALAKQ